MPDQLRPATYRDVIIAEAKKAKVSPELALAMVDVESGTPETEAVTGDQSAVSPKGARGFFQIMPETAKELGIDPADPIQNIRGGLTYLRQMVDKHGGDVRLALAAYNAGPGAVAKAGGVPNFPETQAYVEKILGRLRSGGAAGAPQPNRGRLVAQPPSQAAVVEQTPEEAAGGPPQLPTLPGLQTFRKGIPRPPELSTPETIGAYGASGLQAVGEQFDPRTSEGRRNIAGMAGAAGLTTAAVLTAPVSAPVTGLAALGLGVLGATAGGSMAEAGEQLVGTAPPSEMAVLGAGGQQAAYEAVGQGVGWGVKAVGRRLIATRVGRQVHEALRGFSNARIDQLRSVLDAAKETARDVRAAGREALGQIKGSAPAEYTSLVAQAPADVAERAGKAAQRAIEGPATEARDIVGKAVEEAAKTGPDVDITALKAEAQRVLERIKPPEQAFPRKLVEEGGEAGIADAVRMGNDIFPMGEGTTKALEQKAAAGDQAAAAILAAIQKTGTEALEDAQSIAQREMLKHPAMGVINRILNADDVVPFYAAHLWKTELQDSLRATYDQAATKQVGKITQHLAAGLRDALAVHEPYNAATARYAKIVPLYTKQYAAKFRKLAQTDPDALVRMIKPAQPGPTRMLRDLLVNQSAEGGKAAEGQAAWDLVRTAWTQKNVLKGGIQKLDQNLASLPRSFTDVFYGDQSGRQVFTRLQQIASAYKAGVAVAKREAYGLSRQAGRDITTASRNLQRGRRPTAEEEAFIASSIAGKQLSPAELAAHGIRAIGLGPFQIWGGLSWLKLLTGPQEKDLLHWAYLSDANTQRLVKLFTGPSPTGMAIADVLRAAGVLNEKPTQVAQSPSDITLAISNKPGAQVGQPPPR